MRVSPVPMTSERASGGARLANAIALRVPRTGRLSASGVVRSGLVHGRGSWRPGGWPQWRETGGGAGAAREDQGRAWRATIVRIGTRNEAQPQCVPRERPALWLTVAPGACREAD